MIYLDLCPAKAVAGEPTPIFLDVNSLAVQWLGFCAFTVEGMGSIPVQGPRIPQTSLYGKNRKKKKFSTESVLLATALYSLPVKTSLWTCP